MRIHPNFRYLLICLSVSLVPLVRDSISTVSTTCSFNITYSPLVDGFNLPLFIAANDKHQPPREEGRNSKNQTVTRGRLDALVMPPFYSISIRTASIQGGNFEKSSLFLA